MNNLGDYPLGAKNDPRAPYNEVENPEVEIELYVWYSIGKKIKVKTSDYKIESGADEDGYWEEHNFDNTDFWSLINEECPCPEGFDELDADFSFENEINRT